MLGAWRVSYPGTQAPVCDVGTLNEAPCVRAQVRGSGRRKKDDLLPDEQKGALGVVTDGPATGPSGANASSSSFASRVVWCEMHNTTAVGFLPAHMFANTYT